MFANSFKMIKNHPFSRDDITNRGTLDVKLVSLLWKILLYHAVKMDSVVKFF
jgi:hypothetical protein